MRLVSDSVNEVADPGCSRYFLLDA